MQPSEFWALSPQEWWWEFDARVAMNRRINSATGKGGKFSGPEWDDARKRHKEKMSNGRSSAA